MQKECRKLHLFSFFLSQLNFLLQTAEKFHHLELGVSLLGTVSFIG